MVNSEQKLTISYPILHHVYFFRSGLVKTTHSYGEDGGDLGLYLEKRVSKKYRGKPVVVDYVSNRQAPKGIFLAFYWNNDRLSKEYQRLLAIYAAYGDNQKLLYNTTTKTWVKKTGGDVAWSEPTTINPHQFMNLIRWNKYAFNINKNFSWPNFPVLKRFDDVVLTFESAEQINKLCEETGIDTDELAKLLGFSRIVNHNYRSGKTEMSNYAYTLLMLFTNRHPKLQLIEKGERQQDREGYWHGMIEYYESNDIIIEIRNSLNLTQTQLALILGLSSQQVISMYESGDIAMRPILYTFLLLISHQHPRAILTVKSQYLIENDII